MASCAMVPTVPSRLGALGRVDFTCVSEERNKDQTAKRQPVNEANGPQKKQGKWSNVRGVWERVRLIH